MYLEVERLMRRAARARQVFYSPHARDEMRNENFDERDVLNCLLTGSIVEDQYDSE
jgi:Domain of unknown function (DUF4258)